MTTVGQQPDGNESVSCELFDDEEPPELIAYQVNDRSFISTFHCSRFNKKVFPGRFQLDPARSQKKPYQSNDESSRNGQLQRKIHQPAATMAPTLTLPSRTSFMFWAKGLPSGSSPESCHHRVTTSEPLKANSTPSGLLQRCWYTTLILHC